MPVRKMRSPQITGVELPLPGRVSFHARFFVALNEVGRSVSFETPLLSGPRQPGQLSAWASDATAVIRARASNSREVFTSVVLVASSGSSVISRRSNGGDIR